MAGQSCWSTAGSRLWLVRTSSPPPGADVVDAAGKWVLPGFIDAHAHLGVHEEGEGWAGHDTNEMTGPVQAHVRVLDAINPAEEGFRDAIAGGVLAVNVNPGSGNPIGGQTVAIRCWGRTVDDMVLREPAGHEVGARREPQARLRRAQRDPSTRLGTAAVDQGGFHRRAELHRKAGLREERFFGT